MNKVIDILSLIHDTNECILWPYHTNIAGGYGHIWYEGRMVLAHRLIASINGILPDLWNSKIQVNHRCDKKKCINPKHLFVGSQSDNMRDRENKKRGPNSGKTRCKWGHEFTPENTYVYPNRRVCKTCVSIRDKQYKEAI